MAVSLHTTARVAEVPDEQVWAATDSRRVDAAVVMTAVAGDPRQVEDKFLLWKADQCRWSFKGAATIAGVPEAAISDAAHALIENGVVSDSECYYRPPEGNDIAHALGTLADLDLCEAREGSWRLTNVGLTALTTVQKLTDPTLFFNARAGLPLNDQTMFELAMGLQAAGWKWEPWGSHRPRGMPPPALEYRRLEAKVFYTGRQLSKSYLRCLADADRLFGQGLLALPHGKNDGVYRKIWAGRPFQPGPDSAHLALDMEDLDAPQHLADDEGGEQLEENEEMAWVEALAEALAADPDVAEEGPPATAPSASASASSTDAQVVSAVPAHIPEASLLALRRGNWGVFRFTPTWRSTHGGFEVDCPFHRKSKKSGCRKWFRIKGPSSEDRQAMVHLAMTWCFMARQFSRQHAHVFCAFPDTLPPYAFLEANRITNAPELVRTDEELDREGSSSSSSMPAASPTAVIASTTFNGQIH